MSPNWHDINQPGGFPLGAQKKKQSAPPPVQEQAPAQRSDRHEVRLKSATWKPGPDGFAFNKKCTLAIQAEFLEETIRTRVRAELFVVYDGVEEDLSHQVEAHLDSDGNASAELTLYIGDAYNRARRTDPAAVCQYKARITHGAAPAPLDSELLEMPRIEKLAVDFVEVADVHFHHNCALPCLDESGELIDELGAVFAFAAKQADRELVVEGHADRSGDAQYNLVLSRRRAEAVKALADNDAGLWNGVVEANGRDHAIEPEDYQQTLKSLASRYGWACDPGAVDNQDGPKTRAGVEGFQREHNARFPDRPALAIDGEIGPQTWEGVFHALRGLLDTHVTAGLGLDPPPALTYGYAAGNGIYPCGECCPVTDRERSREDRRVELVFYAGGAIDSPVPPAAGRTLDAGRDPVSEKPWTKTPIAPGKGAPAGAVSLRLISPAKTPHKQYVNLAQNTADQGPELTLVAEATGGAGSRTVTWTVTKGEKNSKRTDPKVGLKADDSSPLVAFADRAATLTSPVKDGRASCILCCGLAGGDQYEVEASRGGQTATASVVTWRRLWYQRTYHKDASVPSMSTSEKQLKDVFIEFVGEPDVTFSDGTAGKVIIGRHNAKTYHALLTKAHANQCVNVIFCDRQFDGVDGKGRNYVSRTTKTLTSQSGPVTVGDDENSMIAVFNPPIQKGASFLLTGSWVNTKTKKKGGLTDDSAKVNASTGLVSWVDELTVTVTLPKDASASKSQPVEVALELTAASGPWGGDGGTPPHNLIKISSNDTVHSMCVMHELGHLMNMVPYAGHYSCPPGFSYGDHSHAYVKMGGSGSHCSFEHDSKKSSKKRYVDGKCIMFHQLNTLCKLKYCESCAPFVKAQMLRAFGELG
jgi:hypothetical protein